MAEKNMVSQKSIATFTPGPEYSFLQFSHNPRFHDQYFAIVPWMERKLVDFRHLFNIQYLPTMRDLALKHFAEVWMVEKVKAVELKSGLTMSRRGYRRLRLRRAKFMCRKCQLEMPRQEGLGAWTWECPGCGWKIEKEV